MNWLKDYKEKVQLILIKLKSLAEKKNTGDAEEKDKESKTPTAVKQNKQAENGRAKENPELPKSNKTKEEKQKE